MVGNGYSMRIAAQISEHIFRAAKGLFGIVSPPPMPAKLRSHTTLQLSFCPFIGKRGRLLLDDFLDASNDSVFEHDFDSVRMLRGFGEDFLNNALRELSAALMLLFHNTHLHSRLELRSILAIHDFIMLQDPVSCIDKSHWAPGMHQVRTAVRDSEK